jgi:hypothetical protein
MGLEVVARDKWNEEYKPEGWSKELFKGYRLIPQKAEGETGNTEVGIIAPYRAINWANNPQVLRAFLNKMTAGQKK